MTQWSEAESGVTVEGTQTGQDGGQSDDACSGSAPCRLRCVMPKVELPALNRSDQRVPVYWDQIVPVWQSSEPCERRKPAPSGSNCRTSEDEVVHGSGSSRRTSSSANNESKVSFDDIMSMYQSSKPSTTAMV